MLSLMFALSVFVPGPMEPPKPPTPVGTGTRYVPKADRGAPRQTEAAGSR